jgi:alpha-galactosidase
VPIDDINYVSAGINHMAFYLKFEKDGQSLYPAIQKVYNEKRIPNWNRVRYEIFNRFGYFVTESSEHFSEYTPWFIKRDRPELIEDFNIPLDEYIRRCENQIAGWHQLRSDSAHLKRPHRSAPKPRIRLAHHPQHGDLAAPRGLWQRPQQRSHRQLARRLLCRSARIGRQKWLATHQNRGLPPHLAAMMQTNINVQSLTVEAALTGKREHVYHAAAFDPHTAARALARPDLESVRTI